MINKYISNKSNDFKKKNEPIKFQPNCELDNSVLFCANSLICSNCHPPPLKKKGKERL